MRFNMTFGTLHKLHQAAGGIVLVDKDVIGTDTRDFRPFIFMLGSVANKCNNLV